MHKRIEYQQGVEYAVGTKLLFKKVKVTVESSNRTLKDCDKCINSRLTRCVETTCLSESRVDKNNIIYRKEP